MTGSHLDPGDRSGIGELGIEPPDPAHLAAYFAFTEAASLLQHHVEQQLRAEGGLSTIQFQILMGLANAEGGLTMTQLADEMVFSRSGLTYQAGLLEKDGLITRGPAMDDERATLVAITEKGTAVIGRVLRGHIEVTQRLLYDVLSDEDLDRLRDMMTRVRDRIRAEPPRSATNRRRRSS